MEKQSFHIFLSRGGRFNMTNIRTRVKVGPRYVWNVILNFATVHLGCFPNNASFGAFNHSKGLLGKLTCLSSGGLWGKWLLFQKRLFTFVSQSAAVVWAVVYICFPVFLWRVPHSLSRSALTLSGTSGTFFHMRFPKYLLHLSPNISWKVPEASFTLLS